MKGHPTRKEIIGAALDAARMTAPLRDHLSSCSACSGIYAEAAGLLAPSVPGLLAPPDGTLARIIAAGRARQVAAGEGLRRSWKEMLLRPAPAFALAAVIIIPLLIFYFNKKGDDMATAFDMTLTRIEAGVPRTAALAPFDTIITPPGGLARIRLDDRLDIALDGGSLLTLEKALRNRTGVKRRLAFILAHGSLQARIKSGAGIEAVFITPHGRVTVLGTEFRLAVTGGKTSVLLREGTLSVENVSGIKDVITGGMKCAMDDGITKAVMNAADLTAFNAASPPLNTTGSPASKKENAGSAAGPTDKAATRTPVDSASAGTDVQEKSSRPAVRGEMKNELRGVKEMRRSMRRGQK